MVGTFQNIISTIEWYLPPLIDQQQKLKHKIYSYFLNHHMQDIIEECFVLVFVVKQKSSLFLTAF